MMAVFTGAIFLLPFYLELVRNLSVARAGMILLLPSIMMMISGPIAGHAADRIGSRKICLLATGIMAISFFLFSLLGDASAFWFLLSSLALMGAGIGIFPPEMEGVSSSVMMTIRNGGAVLGVAIFETTFAGTVGNAASEKIHSGISAGLLITGFNHAFLAGAGLAFMAFLLFWWVKDRK
jgi:MFS family permease